MTKPHWKVKFMRAGWEPPYPFGKTHEIVAADSRIKAIEIVKATGVVSTRYPVTASKTSEPVNYHFAYTET